MLKNSCTLSLAVLKPKNLVIFQYMKQLNFLVRNVCERGNPLRYNVPKWSGTLYKSSSKCCKIFLKVCMTTLGH